uniref:Uncharacterized protein n=1 Tax=Oryza glaberrima TaxID=4538 RepID=I1R0S9_ORYGL
SLYFLPTLTLLPLSSPGHHGSLSSSHVGKRHGAASLWWSADNTGMLLESGQRFTSDGDDTHLVATWSTRDWERGLPGGWEQIGEEKVGVKILEISNPDRHLNSPNVKLVCVLLQSKRIWPMTSPAQSCVTPPYLVVVGNGISKINAATPNDAGKRKKKAVEVESRTREVAITVAGVAVRCSRWLGWCSTSPS